MYAIVKTGGKQYRVEQGQSLLIERLRDSEGDTVVLSPLLYVDGDSVLDGDDLAKVSVEARVLAHERGPKLRIVKFKPKRGYKRRTGHRQELTRIEVTGIKLASRKPRAAKADAAEAAPEAGEAPKPVAAAAAPKATAAAPKAKAPEAAEVAKAPEAAQVAPPEAAPVTEAPEAAPVAPPVEPEAEAAPVAPPVEPEPEAEKPAPKPRTRKPAAKPEEDNDGA